MSLKPSAPLIWRVTLLLATIIGSRAFRFPTQQIISPSLKAPCTRVMPPICVNDDRLTYCLPGSGVDVDSEEVKKSEKHITKAYENKNLPLIQSISVAVASRRLSFLILSIYIVNFVRSKILKVRALLADGGGKVHAANISQLTLILSRYSYV